MVELRLSGVPKVKANTFLVLAYCLLCGPGAGKVNLLPEVCCIRKIAPGFQGIPDSLAKAGIGCVMLAYSRKIACRYIIICTGYSADHHGLFLLIIPLSVSAFALIPAYRLTHCKWVNQ